MAKFRSQNKTRNTKTAAKSLAEVNKLPNDNIITWFSKEAYTDSDSERHPVGEINKFQPYLHAPNYTVFSNTVSAAAHWNKAVPVGTGESKISSHTSCMNVCRNYNK